MRAEICGARCVSTIEGPIASLDPTELAEEGRHVHECGRAFGHHQLKAAWKDAAHLCSCGFRWP